MVAESLKLFFSYSHRDEALRDELGNHLKILEYQGLISSWHDRKILAGDVWDHQINTHLETADIILLLISSDFIASSYCWDIEIKRAMELHEAGSACVIPVILRSSDWTNAPFSKLQAVPKNAQPVTSLPDRDAAFQFVTQQIRQVANDLIEKRKKQRQQQQKDTAIAAYRQKVQEFAADGEISFGEQFLLNELKQELELTDAEVQVIEQPILNPITNQKNLDRYRQLFAEAVTQYGYPFSDKIRTDLKLVQTHLKLSDTEVAQVEATIATAQETKQQPTTPIAETDELVSEKGIDYTRLRDLLKSGQWKKADQETSDRMLEAMGRQKEGRLRIEDIKNIPCADLCTLDHLWVKYSQGKFGFSVQKKIWQECGSPTDYGANWEKFAVRVGWRVTKTVYEERGALIWKQTVAVEKSEWLSWNKLIFSLEAPNGHLPHIRLYVVYCVSFLRRIETCKKYSVAKDGNDSSSN